MTRKRPKQPEPERLGKATRRHDDRRPVALPFTVCDACEMLVLLDFAANVYEAVPPVSQFDVHTALAARGVRSLVDRIRVATIAAIADVVDPDGAVQAELGVSS